MITCIHIFLACVLNTGSISGQDTFSHVGMEQAPHFSNEWLVRISGGPIVARSLADQLGYDNFGEVSSSTTHKSSSSSSSSISIYSGTYTATSRSIRSFDVVVVFDSTG